MLFIRRFVPLAVLALAAVSCSEDQEADAKEVKEETTEAFDALKDLTKTVGVDLSEAFNESMKDVDKGLEDLRSKVESGSGDAKAELEKALEGLEDEKAALAKKLEELKSMSASAAKDAQAELQEGYEKLEKAIQDALNKAGE